MEQQQNDLFAMIGELAYRLQLSQRENERLSHENQMMVERKKFLDEQLTHEINANNAFVRENNTLKDQIATLEGKSNSSKLLGRPQRQYGHEDRLTDEHIAQFYRDIPIVVEEPYPEWYEECDNSFTTMKF